MKDFRKIFLYFLLLRKGATGCREDKSVAPAEYGARRLMTYAAPWLLLSTAACSSDIPTVSLGLEDHYYVSRMQKLPLLPALTGEEYRWSVNGETVSEEQSYIFIAPEEGSYEVTLEIIDSDNPLTFKFAVTVVHEEVEYSPYINRVYEYVPAPGQFVNRMPAYEPGDSYTDMLSKVQDCIGGDNNVLISLGSWGGYVTFGFDHTVVNIAGQKDFRIWGNSFYEGSGENRRCMSAEPGIVEVSLDINCNGIPDDPWYELAGSEYRNTETLHNHTIVYDRSGNTAKWPGWITDESLTFTGTLLPPNATDLSGTGSYYMLSPYGWGYADNHPNEDEDGNSFDIGWAVDSHGNRVVLPGVDFVRVYTGVDQTCGWLGETSTEISKCADLHIGDGSSLE